MSDVLSPAEQARAARWRVGKSYGIHVYSGDVPVATFFRAADARAAVVAYNADHQIEPPESVESLRAERDKAVADVAHYKDQFRLVCDESKSLAVALDAMRDERDEALTEMEEVGTAWRQEQIMHQRAWATIRNLQAELAAALRDNERFEGKQEELAQSLGKLNDANYTIARLRAIHTEAARGRCQRED